MAGEERGTSASSPGTGNEPFAVKRRGHDPPAKAVEEQQRHREADGKAERRVDHVEGDEIYHEDRWERAEHAELREARKRIKLLEQENEVLRRAAAYLSQANLPGK